VRGDYSTMPRSNPRVSILIPTFNQEKFIGSCIASALDQTYDNLEVIVSDDASHDSTEQIARRFLSDPRVRYERNPINIGRVKNYRRLLYELASGDWVLMLDGDDCLLNSNYVLQAMGLALSAPDVVLVFGKVLQGQDVTTSTVPNHTPGLQPLMGGAEFFLRHPPFYDVTPPHMTCLFRRDVAIRIACYRHDILSTDLESFYRLMIGHRIGFVDEIAGLWRQHDCNISKRLSSEVCAKNLIVFTGPREYASSLGLSSGSELEKWVRRGAARYVLGCLIQMFAARDLLEALRFTGYVLMFDIGILGHAIARVARRIFLHSAAQSNSY
jgi:glycosyltransferase involved in cell wall biosynthesis